jgi:hypothetical protein
MKIPVSPFDTIGGISYLPRLLNKIRLYQNGELNPDYISNLGDKFDAKCCDFLDTSYSDLQNLCRRGFNNEQILQEIIHHRGPIRPIEVEMWNDFARKRGWRDGEGADLRLKDYTSNIDAPDSEKAKIEAFFDYIELDEGRKLQ